MTNIHIEVVRWPVFIFMILSYCAVDVKADESPQWKKNALIGAILVHAVLGSVT